jgi:hypothetical protein
MLVGAAAGDSSPCSPVVGLHAFAEAHRIIGERYESFSREVGGHPVILSLAESAVSR